MQDDLEGRFWYNGENPVIAFPENEDIPQRAFAGDRLRPVKEKGLVRRLLTGTVDAFYTASGDTELIKSVLSMGIPVYLPERVDGIKCWPCVRNGVRLFTAGGTRKFAGRERLRRALDIGASLIGCAATVLMLPFVALAIELESPGPVFFIQKRVGYNGRPFGMIKFRSMRVGADAEKEGLMEQNEVDDHMFKIKDDPRITKVGRFLRKYSLDEFPQFFNILKGEMTVVGTRPPIYEEVEGYEPRHKARLSAKPGITGLWQLYARNKPLGFDRIVAMDRDYILHDSIKRYLSLIFETAFGKKRKGA